MKLSKRTLFALSIIPQVIFVKWFGSYPELVEEYYSEGLYPIISKFSRTLFGWVPFSVGDIFYTLLVFSAIRYLYLHGKFIRKKPKQFFQHVGILLSLAYFLFHLLWGMNYYRLPIEQKFELKKTEYSIEELENFTYKLIQTTNRYQNLLANDISKPVRMDLSQKEIFEKTILGYKDFASLYPEFEYQPSSIKVSLYSLPLTYMGYGGYLNPFTGESQVNGKVPIIRFPTVSAHEIGHQIGYSSESATNFIGFIVASKIRNLEFKYSSYSHALAYVLSDLRRFDEERFNQALRSINPGVKKNYEEINRFWKTYENPTEPIFKAIFNSFLKANNQEEGIQSYNAVVGLLINYDIAYGF